MDKRYFSDITNDQSACIRRVNENKLQSNENCHLISLLLFTNHFTKSTHENFTIFLSDESEFLS